MQIFFGSLPRIYSGSPLGVLAEVFHRILWELLKKSCMFDGNFSWNSSAIPPTVAPQQFLKSTHKSSWEIPPVFFSKIIPGVSKEFTRLFIYTFPGNILLSSSEISTRISREIPQDCFGNLFQEFPRYFLKKFIGTACTSSARIRPGVFFLDFILQFHGNTSRSPSKIPPEVYQGSPSGDPVVSHGVSRKFLKNVIIPGNYYSCSRVFLQELPGNLPELTWEFFQKFRGNFSMRFPRYFVQEFSENFCRSSSGTPPGVP